MRLKEIQRRYRMQTPYVFANYPSRFNTNAKIGLPPSHGTGLKNLRMTLSNLRKTLKKILPEADKAKATMHGFRTNIRSWGEDQRLPDGRRRFDEKDLERAIGHAAGFGQTKVSRGYSRQSSDVIPLVPIFDAWARYVTSGGEPHEVIYDPRLHRKVSQQGD
jgi:hypothetical protein